jgi:hypothetical protein
MSSCLDSRCGPGARHASTTLQDDDTSFSMGPGCTSNHSRQFLKLLEGRPSPTLIPFEPNPHGHGVLLPDLGWPLERMVTGRDFVLLRGHCELQACSVLRWLHARPVHQQNVKPQHFPLANPFELTHEPVLCNGHSSEGIYNSVAQRIRCRRVGFSELLSSTIREPPALISAPTSPHVDVVRLAGRC